MTGYYKERLIVAYRYHEASGETYKQISERFGFGKAVNDHIRAMFNRFVKIGATTMDVEDYLEGNYLVSAKALEYHLRFVGESDRQIRATTLAEELGVYDIDRLKCMLRGMTINQPDLLYYTDTLGLDSLTIR